MFHRIGAAAYKKDLTNTVRLCAALSDPQWKYPVVHIAGTNGKGSTSSLIAATLQQAGYKTGLFTSPHLKQFTERIRVNGTEMPQQAVAEFVTRMQSLMEEVQPSFFELTTAMAFEHFSREKVDVAVIETGMGGRLDCTNIVRPLLSVITNISWDHQQFLGDTLPLIAGEKAGIIKPGVPVVIGERQPECDFIFEQKAAECTSVAQFASDEWQAEILKQTLDRQWMRVKRRGVTVFPALETDLPGDYQQRNVATALAALDQMRALGWKLTEGDIAAAFANVRGLTGLSGRMTLLSRQPVVLCDVGHNEAGVKWVISQLMRIPHQRLHLVWGAVNDKDISKILRLLPGDAAYYWVKPDLPRGLDANELASMGAAVGLRGSVYESVAAGLAAAKAAASAEDLIFVGGSTFVVAEVI